MSGSGEGVGLTAELQETLLELGTATLYEASGRECWLPPRLRPTWSGARVVGMAFPIMLSPGDNLPLHLALEASRHGRVLVVDAGNAPFGYWGEVLTVAAQAAGVVGLVIDGGVRDVRELESLNFPVFSSHVALRGTVKSSPGSVGEVISFDGLSVGPDDVIVADVDGVIALPQSRLSEVVQRAKARHEQEQEFITQLRAGATTMDLYKFSRP